MKTSQGYYVVLRSMIKMLLTCNDGVVGVVLPITQRNEALTERETRGR